MKKRNIGLFEIPARMIEENTQELIRLFAGMIVVRAEFRYDKGTIDYSALSDRFEPVDINCHPPKYDVTLQQGDWVIRKA